MKIFRGILPLYKRLIKDSSRGKGYGKNKFVKKILAFFDLLFRSNEVEVHGHKMFLTKKGFERINVIRFCKYEKFDDVLKGMASEFTDEIEQQILKLAEMIGKERPNPFYQIDNPNAN